ncbi:hypothetical protein [Nitrosospira sp. Nsp1]|uniref:hypothetical protein n=1 Tax=Nitrosospira sp. Nsp1 TaxID=136547 RepID=UPI000882023F|nr:hypothetical protein [Nitrosospira sp. Nsp1]SCX58955.1 hypothetical protein SAMN05720354_12226 [Nitrosospira sp. Nsp1]
MSDFENGDIVLTPTGRAAKVNRYWEESRRDDYARVDLTYADTGEQVKLSPKLLEPYKGEQPKRCWRERKERGDVSIEPKRVFRRLDDTPIPEFDIVEQLLLMDGCMTVQIQGQAGGLASSKKRRILQ